MEDDVAGGALMEAERTSNGRPMIRLRGLEKRFSGQEEPAVHSLDLDVPEGEIAVLVGPSGCGKTTTLRLINRLIEPTGGRIELQGEDVTDVHPDRLRRRMGYVIQQIGLFPHQTIAENIGTVPRLIGWDGERIASRVEELLEVVGMDPAEYRSRYPRELSGGQSQRVGVARAMAADPPVLLMDEPFGAIDPITRERLQDEFLRVQDDLHKTVVFVTHDIDEAVKLGDRICLLRQGGRVVQYDTPERLLTAPADEFAEQFIGSGALVRGLRLARVESIEPAPWPTVELGTDIDAARGALRADSQEHLLVLDDEGRPRRWVPAAELGGEGAITAEMGEPVRASLDPRATLHEALDQMLDSGLGITAAVDRRGAYRGVVDLGTLAGAISEMRRNGNGARSEAADRSGVDAAGGER